MSARSATAGELLTVLAALGLCVNACNRARPADPLHVAYGQANDAAAKLDAATTCHEERLRAEVRRRVALCPPAEEVQRRACLTRAGVETAIGAQTERNGLRFAALYHATARDKLKEAATCREQALPCEAEHRVEAERLIGQAVASIPAKVCP